MEKTKIRWAGNTWNPMVGCTEVSPGCDHCYARVIAEKFGPPAYPNGFDPTFKPKKLADPRKWKTPTVVFVNSMSDIHHEQFATEQVDQVYDTMLEVDRHQYLVLTKRPQRMARYFLGSGHRGDGEFAAPGFLDRRGLDRVPSHIWLGTSIENDRYTFRADHLRKIPVNVRFISAEPLLGPLPSLDLTDIAWVIVGGESGPGYRPMPHEWAREIRDLCSDAGAAFFFKQSAAPRTERGMALIEDDDHPLTATSVYEQYPIPPTWELGGARLIVPTLADLNDWMAADVALRTSPLVVTSE